MMSPRFIQQRDEYKNVIVQNFGIDADCYAMATSLLAEIAVPVRFRKGDYLQRCGLPAQEIYWLARGVARTGFLTETGADVTLHFAAEGDLSSSFEDVIGALRGQGAHHFVIAETAVEAFRYSWGELRRLRAECPQFADYYNSAIEFGVIRSARISIQRGTSTQQRLFAFRREYPGLESRISQKVLASYLDVTPQYLSQLLRKTAQPDSA